MLPERVIHKFLSSVIMCDRVGHQVGSYVATPSKISGDINSANAPGHVSTVGTEKVARPMESVDRPNSHNDPNIVTTPDNFGPWMLVSKKGPKNSVGLRSETRVGFKERAHAKGQGRPLQLNKIQGASSSMPPPGYYDKTIASNSISNIKVSSQNSFSAVACTEEMIVSNSHLACTDELMENLETVRPTPCPQLSVAGYSSSVQSPTLTLSSPILSNKKPPDPHSSSSKPLNSKPPCAAKHGDTKREPTHNPVQFDLLCIRSRERSNSPSKLRSVDRRSSPHNRERRDESLWHQARTQKFNARMNRCNLMDLGYSGPHLTWSNGRQSMANTLERLDRAACNSEWRLASTKGVVRNLPRTYSDHSLMVVYTQGMSSHPLC
ncbi:hypothetical protein LOK49_LG01G02852 [Camellia lanceoleosa]|uniref:Uncharacterized protein n=1 Tax=Camellia lanceoleosa TaxID=1840588 RepID=A0ACC0IXW4_9ERIC|nr:hypothetical protein LOK49_LG01G02852 [Camellia lanceoleosa]